MNLKQLLGFFTILIGLGFIIFLDHENDRLDAAKERIANAKREMHKQESSLFSLNPIGAKITADLEAGPKRKIADAEKRIAHYDVELICLQAAGITVVAVGVIIMHVFHRTPRKKKRKKRKKRGPSIKKEIKL